MWMILLLACWLMGYLMIYHWRKDFFQLEKIFLSLVLGIGVVSLFMFLLGIIPLPLTPNNILLFSLSFCLLLIFLNRKRIGEIVRINTSFGRRPSLTEMVFVALITFTIFWSFSQTIFWPPWEWDTLALYDFRAKIISQTHSLAAEVFTAQPNLTAYNYVYPFSTSLMHALVYIGGGSNPQFIYSIFYASMIILLYACIRRKLSRLMSLILSALLASTPEVIFPSTIAYPNLPFALYFSLSTIYFWEWMFYRKTCYLFTSAILLGLSAWIRNTEPFWIVNIIFISLYFLVVHRRISLLLSYFLIFFPMQRLWPYYQKYVFSSNPNIVFAPPETFSFDLSKLPSVLYFVLKYFVNDWFGYVLILFVAVAFFWKSNSLKKLILAWLLGYLGLSILGTYFFAVSFPWWNEIGGSAQRVSVFFAPLLLYVIALYWSDSQRFFKEPFRRILLSLKVRNKKLQIINWP